MARFCRRPMFLRAPLPAILATALLFAGVAPPAIAETPPALELPAPPPISSPVWLVAEFGSRQILAGNDIDSRVSPASLTKVATAMVVLRAIRDGELSAEKTVVPPPDITRGGGSRMYLEPGRPVSVDELLKGLIVVSANDAARLLAESVAGSEADFVGRLNALAESLGLSRTRFANATGRSDEQHYTTARDLATLAGALIHEFPDAYARYFAEKRFTHNTIEQLNRNRLLWIDPTVDGLKTGHTRDAGYCLIASSQRGERRLITVVIGAADDASRVADGLALLNHGFLKFEALRLYRAGETLASFPVWYGTDDEIAVGLPDQDLTIAVPRGQGALLSAEMVSRQPLHAPIAAGQPLGRVRLRLGSEPWGEYPVYSLAEIPATGLFGWLADSLRLWWNPDGARRPEN
jgi:D-alanyl-D-alanine carboxypeptidase (penicillin-binding protein 5/6)